MLTEGCEGVSRRALVHLTQPEGRPDLPAEKVVSHGGEGPVLVRPLLVLLLLLLMLLLLRLMLVQNCHVRVGHKAWRRGCTT